MFIIQLQRVLRQTCKGLETRPNCVWTDV